MPNKVHQTVARDSDNWKQCHDRGQIVPIYEAKKESRLQDFVEISNNPFDSGKSITGPVTRNQNLLMKKQRQKLLDRIEKENDPDIKRELKQGNDVMIIEGYRGRRPDRLSLVNIGEDLCRSLKGLKY